MNWWILLGIVGMASFIVAIGADDSKDKKKRKSSDGGFDLPDFGDSSCGTGGDCGGDGGGGGGD